MRGFPAARSTPTWTSGDRAAATGRGAGPRAAPRGGWFRQTFAPSETITLPDGRIRPAATLIHFLLTAGDSSAWHRVSSDEVWLSHLGTVRLQLGGRAGAPTDGDVLLVGTGAGELTQALVPGGTWQRTLPGDADALVSCLVTPGFDFDDFELAEDGKT